MPSSFTFPDSPVVLGLALGSVGLVLTASSVRGLVTATLRHAVRIVRAITAAVAWVYDLLLPIHRRNAKLVRTPVVIWSAMNLAPVACSAASGWRRGPYIPAEWAMAANGTLCVVNLLFLTGAYWALREGVDIMNGDRSYRHRQFADLSTAKNLPLVCWCAVLTLLQVSTILQWLQDDGQLALIVVHDSFGADLLDNLAAVASTFPILSLLFSLPGLAHRVEFLPGTGALCAKVIAGYGSVLIVSTILGFVQQSLSLRRLIVRILEQTDVNLKNLLRMRLKRAPSESKHHLHQAFASERDDAKRLLLLDLALEKSSFSAPVYFLRGYTTYSHTVKKEGTAMIAQFLDSKGGRLEKGMLLEICQVARTAHDAGAIRSREDARLVGQVVVPCLAQLMHHAQHDAALARRVIRLVRHQSMQRMLSAIYSSDTEDAFKRRAGELLRAAERPDGPAGAEASWIAGSSSS
jgi:hypothetical protein